MKKQILILALISLLSASCSSYVKIGKINMVSNRNINTNQEYKLIEKDVEGIGEVSVNSDAFGEALDNAVKKFKNGEYMMNVSIYITKNTKKMKVVGDVWGIVSKEMQNISQKFNVGDTVMIEWKKDILEAVILAKNETEAIVQFKYRGSTKKEKIRYEDLTKK